MNIIGCSNSIKEAEELSKSLNQDFVKVIKRVFPDGEMHLHLSSENIDEEVIIYQNMYPEQDSAILELLFVTGLCKELGAQKISLISPWFSYSRQDKKWYKKEAYTLRTLCGLLKNMGVSTVYSFDIHFRRKPGKFKKFGIIWHNLTAARAIKEYVEEEYDSDFLIIGPDAGSNEMVEVVGGKVVFKKTKKCNNCEKPAQECKCNKKEKDYEVVQELKKEIKESQILMLDDIIGGGSTILKALEELRGKKTIIVGITHGFFLKNSFEKISKKVDEVISTNSIKSEASKIRINKILIDYLRP